MAVTPIEIVGIEKYRLPFADPAVFGDFELGKWIQITKDMTLNRFGGAFMGYNASGETELVNGANVTNFLGWGARSVDKSTYVVGEEILIFFRPDCTFQLAVDTPANIATMQIGQAFALKLDGDGNQVIDTAASANQIVTLVDKDQPQREGMVRVKIIPGKTNLA